MAQNPKFDAILQVMRSLHDRKNADYASGDNPYSNFEEAATAAGISIDQGFAFLMGIKQARIKELTASGKTPNNESLQDSRLDLAVYAALRASYTHVEVPSVPIVEEGTYWKAMPVMPPPTQDLTSNHFGPTPYYLAR